LIYPFWARFVVDIVEQLDLNSLKTSYSGRGSHTYNPEDAGTEFANVLPTTDEIPEVINIPLITEHSVCMKEYWTRQYEAHGLNI